MTKTGEKDTKRGEKTTKRCFENPQLAINQTNNKQKVIFALFLRQLVHAGEKLKRKFWQKKPQKHVAIAYSPFPQVFDIQ